MKKAALQKLAAQIDDATRHGKAIRQLTQSKTDGFLPVFRHHDFKTIQFKLGGIQAQ